MAKVLDEKCLNCSATIKFNSKKNLFICDYCQSSFTIEEIKAAKEKINKEENLEKEFSKLEDIDGYNCSNCGATIITADNTSSTSCVYCKSNAIIKNRLTGIYKPEQIITFKQDKEDAINAFKKICKGRLLIPKDFSNSSNIQEMEGLYVPFWLYDCVNDANLIASCTKVSTWMDAHYSYTKTDKYEVKRKGRLHFNNIPNDAAMRFEDTIMHAIEPFEYKEFQKFEPGFLAGYLSEKFDVMQDTAYLNTKQRIESDSKNYLRNSINGYTSVNITENTNNIALNNTNYVLLPVWVLNIKFNNKIYHFAMNGQTGKLVGEIPVDKKKLFLTILITLVLSFGLILLIYVIQGYNW